MKNQSPRYAAILLSLWLMAAPAGCQQAPTTVETVPPAVIAATVTGPATAASLQQSTPLPATPTVEVTQAEEPSAAPGTEPAATQTPLALIPAPTPFDGQRAYQDVLYQMSLGSRTPGSDAHGRAVDWIQAELEKNNWKVEIQETTQGGQPVRNVIARRGQGSPWRIIGAHFDSRMKADNDPDPANHETPVPGANDGASGVAVLLELSRVLPEDAPGETWLAFFDSEDQGRLPGWDWILGSRALANSLAGKPDAVVVVDMIGDADQQIYQERNSDPGLTQEIWSIAGELGYSGRFIPTPKFSMLDDHTPFLEKGIRAVDLIDFDYPYWHTVSDTAEKVSAESLEAVGNTVLHWLLR